MYKLGRLKILIHRMTRRWDASTCSLPMDIYLLCNAHLSCLESFAEPCVLIWAYTISLLAVVFSGLHGAVVGQFHVDLLRHLQDRTTKLPWMSTSAITQPPYADLTGPPTPRKYQAFERWCQHQFWDSRANFYACAITRLASGCNSLLWTLVFSRSWPVSAEWFHLSSCYFDLDLINCSCPFNNNGSPWLVCAVWRDRGCLVRNHLLSFKHPDVFLTMKRTLLTALGAQAGPGHWMFP